MLISSHVPNAQVSAYIRIRLPLVSEVFKQSNFRRYCKIHIVYTHIGEHYIPLYRIRFHRIRLIKEYNGYSGLSLGGRLTPPDIYVPLLLLIAFNSIVSMLCVLESLLKIVKIYKESSTGIRSQQIQSLENGSLEIKRILEQRSRLGKSREARPLVSWSNLRKRASGNWMENAADGAL